MKVDLLEAVNYAVNTGAGVSEFRMTSGDKLKGGRILFQEIEARVLQSVLLNRVLHILSCQGDDSRII